MLLGFKKAFFFTIFYSVFTQIHAGFGLETTRVIYAEKDRNQSVVAFNTDKYTSYLTQSWIENQDNKLSPDFIATPPILKLRPEQKNTIQITKNANLSAVQESLYWLNVKFIAPIPENAENVLKYSMTHRIKIMYRPTELTNIPLEQEVKKLQWKIQNDHLILNNPTAFYINFAKVEVAGKDIKTESYIAPHSQQSIALGFSTPTNSVVNITYINDYGKSILLQP